jgi:hypothetical protein
MSAIIASTNVEIVIEAVTALTAPISLVAAPEDCSCSIEDARGQGESPPQYRMGAAIRSWRPEGDRDPNEAER